MFWRSSGLLAPQKKAPRAFSRFRFAVCLLPLLALPAAGADIDRLSQADLRFYNAIKPRTDEMRWKQIPWMVNLAAAVETAKKEARPLFFFVSGDEPLERC